MLTARSAAIGTFAATGLEDKYSDRCATARSNEKGRGGREREVQRIGPSKRDMCSLARYKDGRTRRIWGRVDHRTRKPIIETSTFWRTYGSKSVGKVASAGAGAKTLLKVRS